MAKRTRMVAHPNLLIGRSGRPAGVVLTMREFRHIVALLEDVADVTWMKARTPEEKRAVHWDDVKRRLKKRGLL